jgi:hypothetical protein
MRLWMTITFIFGIILVGGVIITAYDLLFLKPAGDLIQPMGDQELAEGGTI